MFEGTNVLSHRAVAAAEGPRKAANPHEVLATARKALERHKRQVYISPPRGPTRHKVLQPTKEWASEGGAHVEPPAAGSGGEGSARGCSSPSSRYADGLSTPRASLHCVHAQLDEACPAGATAPPGGISAGETRQEAEAHEQETGCSTRVQVCSDSGVLEAARAQEWLGVLRFVSSDLSPPGAVAHRQRRGSQPGAGVPAAQPHFTARPPSSPRDPRRQRSWAVSASPTSPPRPCVDGASSHNLSLLISPLRGKVLTPRTTDQGSACMEPIVHYPKSTTSSQERTCAPSSVHFGAGSLQPVGFGRVPESPPPGHMAPISGRSTIKPPPPQRRPSTVSVTTFNLSALAPNGVASTMHLDRSVLSRSTPPPPPPGTLPAARMPHENSSAPPSPRPPRSARSSWAGQASVRPPLALPNSPTGLHEPPAPPAWASPRGPSPQHAAPAAGPAPEPAPSAGPSLRRPRSSGGCPCLSSPPATPQAAAHQAVATAASASPARPQRRRTSQPAALPTASPPVAIVGYSHHAVRNALDWRDVLSLKRPGTTDSPPNTSGEDEDVMRGCRSARRVSGSGSGPVASAKDGAAPGGLLEQVQRLRSPGGEARVPRVSGGGAMWATATSCVQLAMVLTPPGSPMSARGRARAAALVPDYLVAGRGTDPIWEVPLRRRGPLHLAAEPAEGLSAEEVL